MSAWVKHVKEYAAKNKVSYKEALKKAGASYKKKETPKKATKKAPKKVSKK